MGNSLRFGNCLSSISKINMLVEEKILLVFSSVNPLVEYVSQNILQDNKKPLVKIGPCDQVSLGKVGLTTVQSFSKIFFPDTWSLQMINIYLHTHWKKWGSMTTSKPTNNQQQNRGSLTLCVQNLRAVNWVKRCHQAGSLGSYRTL